MGANAHARVHVCSWEQAGLWHRGCRQAREIQGPRFKSRRRSRASPAELPEVAARCGRRGGLQPRGAGCQVFAPPWPEAVAADIELAIGTRSSERIATGSARWARSGRLVAARMCPADRRPAAGTPPYALTVHDVWLAGGLPGCVTHRCRCGGDARATAGPAVRRLLVVCWNPQQEGVMPPGEPSAICPRGLSCSPWRSGPAAPRTLGVAASPASE